MVLAFQHCLPIITIILKRGDKVLYTLPTRKKKIRTFKGKRGDRVEDILIKRPKTIGCKLVQLPGAQIQPSTGVLRSSKYAE